MIRLSALQRAVYGACALWAASYAGHARADKSNWSKRVGSVDVDERTTWCTPALTHVAGAGDKLSSSFQRIALFGFIENDIPMPGLEHSIRMKCSNSAGTQTSVVTSPASRDADGDKVSVQCPANQPIGSFPMCQVNSGAVLRFVYKGSDCGDGLGFEGLTPPVHDAALIGQLTGGFYELIVRSPYSPGLGLLNNTCDSTPALLDPFRTCRRWGYVGGTDLGFMFLAKGRLNFGFGDTWPSEATTTLTNPRVDARGTILFQSDDMDPSNGIVFNGYESTALDPKWKDPRVAAEVIPSIHNILLGEQTAIASAGLALNEGGVRYRVLWFTSLRRFATPGAAPPLPTDLPLTNFGTLAVSTDAGTGSFGPFVRGETLPNTKIPKWAPLNLNVGTPDNSFGSGAIWVDREQGWVYFFGVPTYNPTSVVRLARVGAKFAFITDFTQYEYYTGPQGGWVRDTDGRFAKGTRPLPGVCCQSFGNVETPRPEFSVVFDSYANRFLMMFSENSNNPRMQIWQAPDPTGPWTKVDTGVPANDSLPNNSNVPGLYAPYMSEHIMQRGGQDVYFTLSQWASTTLLLPPVMIPQPYNVGLWKLTASRATLPGCPAPPPVQ